ncbi:hypothetical protein NPIL_81821 [Nephila pilipes]|uniref:Uncharacterized protein n=1 Tax=Nephila pilipes TaxID=299642 RepID=A0A8X6UHM1_NEPPI|nr:hypothetical protein NPIL_81821 [Nephila pilipes]
MELTTTPTSSPASSPIPIPQGESPCLTRRKFAMEMEVLNLKIISQKSLLGNIQRYPQYEETQLFQIEQNELTILEAKRDQMVSAFQSIDPCEIIGCPHHSHINLTPRQIQVNNLSPKKTPINQNKRKDENGFISPPLRKTAKINQNQIQSQNLLITSNRFQNLNQFSNEASDSHVPTAQKPITDQIPNVPSLPPPIMLKITKNYEYASFIIAWCCSQKGGKNSAASAHCEILRTAQMSLHKWCGNNSELTPITEGIRILITDEVKTLKISYGSLETDCLPLDEIRAKILILLKYQFYPSSLNFDPLGLLGPVVHEIQRYNNCGC